MILIYLNINKIILNSLIICYNEIGDIMKKKLVMVIIMSLFLFVGCGKTEEPSLKVKSLTDTKTRVSVNFNDNKVPESTKLIVNELAVDYSDLSDKITKYVAYDISLISDSDYSFDDTYRVSFTLPSDFNRRNLAVYYVENNEIKKEYDIEVSKDIVTFETDHFSIYVLAQVKPEEIEENIVPKVNSDEE